MEAHIFDVPGLVEAHQALAEGLDFRFRKIEAILGRVVGNPFYFLHFEQCRGVFQFALFIVSAFGLNPA